MNQLSKEREIEYLLIAREVCGTSEDSQEATNALRSMASKTKPLQKIVMIDDIQEKEKNDPLYAKLFEVLMILSKRHGYCWWDPAQNINSYQANGANSIKALITDRSRQELPDWMGEYISKEDKAKLADDAENLAGKIQTYFKGRLAEGAYSH